MRKFLPLKALLGAQICAAAAPSGLAEGTFRKATVADVQAKFASNCVSQGRTVEDVNPIQISCGHDVLGVRAETWHAITTWTLIQAGEDIKVSAAASVRFPNGSVEQIRGRSDIVSKMRATLALLGAE